MTKTSIVPQPGIRFATDRQGGPVEWPLDGPGPHMILTGESGVGASSTARVIAVGGAMLDLDVRFCDAKLAGARDLQAVPGITVAAGLPETAGLIGRTWADMCQRQAGSAADAGSAGNLQRIVLIIDNFTLLAVDMNDICTAERPNPVVRQLGQLLTVSPDVTINVLLTGLACHVALVLGDSALQQCGTRVALGQVGGQAAQLLFGDENACGASAGRTPGRGVVLTPVAALQPAVMLDPPMAGSPPPST